MGRVTIGDLYNYNKSIYFFYLCIYYWISGIYSRAFFFCVAEQAHTQIRPHKAVMEQWLSRWIHNPVFPFHSAFHPSEVGEMSSNVINAAKECRGCSDSQKSSRSTLSARVRVNTPGWYALQSRDIMHNANVRVYNIPVMRGRSRKKEGKQAYILEILKTELILVLTSNKISLLTYFPIYVM